MIFERTQALIASKNGERITLEELQAISTEITGREARDPVAAAAEYQATARSTVSYLELRSILADRYGWSFETIDHMSMTNISAAAAHASGKQPRVHDEALHYLLWRDHFREIVGLPVCELTIQWLTNPSIP